METIFDKSMEISKKDFYKPSVSSVKMYWRRNTEKILQKHREAAKAISIVLAFCTLSVASIHA